MTTIFTHPAVAQYLAELDEALRTSPGHHADDLRDQVREHLGDALGPEATDAEVEAVLARLGPPSRLTAGENEPPAAVIYTRPSMTGWLKQRPRNFWAAIVAVAALLAAAIVAVTVETHIAPIDAGCQPCAFAFPEDRLHLHDLPAFDDDHMVVTQQLRSGPGRHVHPAQSESVHPGGQRGSDRPTAARNGRADVT